AALRGHQEGVRALAFGPGDRLASIGPDGCKVWETIAGLERTAWRGGQALAVSPGGRRLALVAPLAPLRLIGPSRGLVLELAGPPPGELALAFSPDGARLAAAGDHGQGRAHLVQVWDARTGRALPDLCGHTRFVTGLAFGPGGRLASASLDGTWKVWG